jgi:bifunctional non-homologous end joining protein LigD
LASKSVTIEAGGIEVTVTNPDKVFFPKLGLTKLDLVRYYEAVSEGALRGVMRRPMVLKRFVNGAAEEPFFQKRAPANLPPWIDTARVTFPSGRFADLVVPDAPADLLWAINLGCIDLNPWPVRADDVDHPDELRIDLDPTPEATFEDVKRTAMVFKQTLEDFGYRGFPKTSGSRGIHIYVRIEPKWEFPVLRRAGLALAREVERRAPELVTTKWWKEERHGVFIDYNQNARDRTIASAYSVRPTPDARVSAPLTWEELPGVELSDFTVETMPQRFEKLGDLMAGIDDEAFSLDALIELTAQQEREGQGDAPWPPQFPKAKGEPKRVQPSRARKEDGAESPTGRRKSVHPLIIIAKAQHKDEALAGLQRWKARHPDAAALLEPSDVLVDSMRGMSSTWTRIRVNLRNVPEAQRPAEETPDPDYDPWAGLSEEMRGRQTRRVNPKDGRLEPSPRSSRGNQRSART